MSKRVSQQCTRCESAQMPCSFETLKGCSLSSEAFRKHGFAQSLKHRCVSFPSPSRAGGSRSPSGRIVLAREIVPWTLMSQVPAWISNSFTAEILSPVVLYYFGTYGVEDQDETTQGRPGLKTAGRGWGGAGDSPISELFPLCVPRTQRTQGAKPLHSGGARLQPVSRGPLK